VVQPWLPREAVAAPSPAVLKAGLDGAGSTLGWRKGSLSGTRCGPFQPTPFCGSAKHRRAWADGHGKRSAPPEQARPEDQQLPQPRRYLMAALQSHPAAASPGVRPLAELALGHEALLGRAVPTLVGPFVEGPGVPQRAPEAAHGPLVPGLAGAGEVGEGDGGLGQGPAEQARDALAQLRGRCPRRGRGLLDLQPVLVGPWNGREGG